MTQQHSLIPPAESNAAALYLAAYRLVSAALDDAPMTATMAGLRLRERAYRLHMETLMVGETVDVNEHGWRVVPAQ